MTKPILIKSPLYAIREKNQKTYSKDDYNTQDCKIITLPKQYLLENKVSIHLFCKCLCLSQGLNYLQYRREFVLPNPTKPNFNIISYFK